MSTIIDKIKNLPQAPGVYFFYGEDKNLLYIGKATSLRSRVQSYFRGVISSEADKFSVQGRSEWIGRMVAQVTEIDFQETESVLEALILESNLIKARQPKYNTMEKDDKSFSYFAITKEEFPRVLIFRRTDLDLEKNELVQKGFSFKKLKAESYKLKAIFGPYTSKHQMQIALKIMRRIFPFHAHKQKSEKGCLDFQLGVCPGPYDGAISKEDYKKNIRGIRMILEGKKKRLIGTLEKEMQAAAKKNEFEKAADIRNKIYALQHIRDVALMTREFEEDKFQISNDKFQTNSNLQNSNLEIDSKFKIQNSKFLRIEAYDISNISGEHAVGSMVVFENGQPNKSQYRKFKIKTVVGSNDVGMMKEVLLRRFKNDWPMPDLILLDGGIGHVNMAEKILHDELGLAVEIVGVAKGPTRKNLNLQIANSKQITNIKISNEIQQILGNENLLKHIMDEAHRFAITYHRKVRHRNYGIK